MKYNLEVKRGGEVKLQKGFIDLRDNGLKKNLILRKKARFEQRIQNIFKWFKLVGISLGVILIVSHNLNFKFDIVNSDFEDQEIEKQMNDVINEVLQPEENIKDYKEEFQEDIKQEILEKKKAEQKKEIKKATVQENRTLEKQIIHNEWSLEDERQDWINYAYKIGGKDFVLTLLAENGTMGIDRKSGIVGANGYSDYGLCQINVGYHQDILSDGKNGKRFKDWFYDPYKQLDYCNKLFTTGTKFYGYDVRHKVAHKLNYNEI